MTPRGDVDAALAGLQARWGAAAPRVVGALALAPALAAAPAEVDEAPDARPSIAPLPEDRWAWVGVGLGDETGPDAGPAAVPAARPGTGPWP